MHRTIKGLSSLIFSCSITAVFLSASPAIAVKQGGPSRLFSNIGSCSACGPSQGLASIRPTRISRWPAGHRSASALTYPALLFLAALVCAALGFRLQSSNFCKLSTEGDGSDSRAALGLATFLTAIVIGVISDDAIRTYDQANDSIQGLAIDALALDQILDSYGSKADLIRTELKAYLGYRIDQIRAKNGYDSADFKEVGSLSRVELLYRRVADLNPGSDIQSQLKSRALSVIGEWSGFGSGSIAQERWLFVVGDSNAPRSLYFLVLLSISLEFFCFGLLVRPRRFTGLSTVLASLVVSATLLVVVELDDPIEGLITVSLEPLIKAESLMNR